METFKRVNVMRARHPEPARQLALAEFQLEGCGPNGLHLMAQKQSLKSH
jgi:hypothetical protein